MFMNHGGFVSDEWAEVAHALAAGYANHKFRAKGTDSARHCDQRLIPLGASVYVGAALVVRGHGDKPDVHIPSLRVKQWFGKHEAWRVDPETGRQVLVGRPGPPTALQASAYVWAHLEHVDVRLPGVGLRSLDDVVTVPADVITAREKYRPHA